ncbi:unnamed protein product [Oncorhynchus mykiss]|uniref:Uncharacterized protein n=1 Tax=Oncorhynchus mykiss TaxID=8022 RepID=A0A060XMF9_ONCMY|nr:unnamed protein product [Oncorhynchus mykiss]
MFLQRKSLQRELCEFCHKHRFGAVVAMTISFNERSEPHRQLAVYSSSTLYREEFCRPVNQTPPTRGQHRNKSLSIRSFGRTDPTRTCLLLLLTTSNQETWH